MRPAKKRRHIRYADHLRLRLVLRQIPEHRGCHGSMRRNVSMAEHQLPEPFADLAPYLAWSLPTERERSAKRQASTLAEITAFYQAMLPRMEEVLSYLAQY